MNNLGLSLDELRERVAKRTRKTERGELMAAFMEVLNTARRGTKFKQITYPGMGAILTKIPTEDLYYIYSICDSAGRRSQNYFNGFSRTFFWERKPRKTPPIQR